MNDLELWSKFLDVFFINGSENVVLGELPVGSLEPVEDFDKVSPDSGDGGPRDFPDPLYPYAGPDMKHCRFIPTFYNENALWKELLVRCLKQSEKCRVTCLVISGVEKTDDALKLVFDADFCDIADQNRKFTWHRCGT